MRGLIIDGWASPRSRQLQSAATSGSCPASSAALHSRAGGVAQRVPAPWLTSLQASSGRGPRGAGAGLMHSSLFLATAAALRTFCIRPSTGVCTLRAASYQSRPRRSRPSLACETSFAPSRDDTCAADVRPAPAPPAELPPRPNGIVVAYKPQNWTSFDVVAKARGCLESELRTAGHVFRRRSRLKVGHGGTLDPMAEGILVLGIGTGCRGLDEYLKGGKAYRATAQLGFETDTQDATGQVTSTGPTAHVTVSALQEAAARMVGTILQRPPIYSAIKRDGKRLHNLARAGKLHEADVEPRQVQTPKREPCSLPCGVLYSCGIVLLFVYFFRLSSARCRPAEGAPFCLSCLAVLFLLSAPLTGTTTQQPYPPVSYPPPAGISRPFTTLRRAPCPRPSTCPTCVCSLH